MARIDALYGRAPGQTSGGGAILGAIVGGLIGSQIGGGAGRTAATAVGVLGGAAAGNAIEGRHSGGSSVQGYRMTVELDRGGVRLHDVPSPGNLRPGDRVRLQGGQITRN
ncbi:glycine zipper 2TM domain-containing protein [Acidovorax lacteus]|uniref:Glycine zipper 2TM domain-containing protein n=1 Tax=Acidovorax lacteus TaxID=1924988 RepID=A0ABP8LHK0_9BURK